MALFRQHLMAETFAVKNQLYTSQRLREKIYFIWSCTNLYIQVLMYSDNGDKEDCLLEMFSIFSFNSIYDYGWAVRTISKEHCTSSIVKNFKKDLKCTQQSGV